MAKLTVYSWTGHAPSSVKVPGRTHDHQQVRCVMAASSKAEIARILGWRGPGRTGEPGTPSETTNDGLIAIALSKPRTLFVSSFFGSEFIEMPTEEVA